MKYVAIPPVHDEEEYLPFTIESMIRQTLVPAEWVIVDDGSNDRSREIIEATAREHPWIRPSHRRYRGFRKCGAGIIEAFHDGYNSLSVEAYTNIDLGGEN